jgi:hypothetical protein
MTHWLQLAAYATQIAMAIGATLFTVCVLWPSIRLQTKFIKAQEKNGVDDLIDKL